MDLRTCRKISFARYFSDSKFEDDEEAEAVCGHCDNVRFVLLLPCSHIDVLCTVPARRFVD